MVSVFAAHVSLMIGIIDNVFRFIIISADDKINTTRVFNLYL